MKITKTRLKEIIEEELQHTLSEDASLLSPHLEGLFGEGEAGHNFAEALATTLMLDEENDFQAMVQAIKDGLENWYSIKYGEDTEAKGFFGKYK